MKWDFLPETVILVRSVFHCRDSRGCVKNQSPIILMKLADYLQDFLGATPPRTIKDRRRKLTGLHGEADTHMIPLFFLEGAWTSDTKGRFQALVKTAQVV